MYTDPLELDAELMRRLGYRAVDLLVRRIAELDHEPAWRGATPAQLEAELAERVPGEPLDFETILEQFTTSVLPYAARVDHARFLGFVPGAPTWPGILADFIAAGCNIFQGTWMGAAGASQVELVVLEWFREWLGLPATMGGLFLSGGSAANLIAIASARHVRFGGHVRDAVLFTSTESHSSVFRAARMLGFHDDQIGTLPVDAESRLSVENVRAALEADRQEGRTPFMVVANAGATSTGAIDPLPELAALCREHAVWLHVDAAYGGFAIITGRGRDLLQGIGEADSITLDPHKWLYQPFEAGCLLVRDGEHLTRTFSVLPDYLQDTATAGRTGVNFADRGFQLTRSPRALKVWLSLKYFGIDAFRAAIDHCLDLACHAERVIRASPDFEILSPATLGIVCFRRIADASEPEIERANAALVAALGDSGVGLISSTRVGGRYALRLCILGHRTRAEDLDRVLDWLARAPFEFQREDNR